MIKFYNTLSRKKDKFKPLEAGRVGIYTCGPTVYDFAHIGNLRAYIFADILHRTLKYAGLKVNHVVNITDVGHLTSDADTGEDRMEKAVAREHKSIEVLTERYSQAFFADLDKLNIDRKSIIFPRASEHIAEQIDLIKKLEAGGFTYQTKDGVYFDTAKFPTYGRLAKLDIAGLEAGARVEANPEKKNPTDFALWKFSPAGGRRAQEWDSPWGVGFPGWHLECSAMSMKYLGEQFDIHTGGIDHVPVHHTNEIAQSEAAGGQRPFVRFWLHSGYITEAGQKMAKRKGKFLTLSALEEKDYSPIAYRYLVLTAHYRKNINFTFEALEAAANAWGKLADQFLSLGKTTGQINEHYQKLFSEAIADDLNIPAVLAILWQVIDAPAISPADKKATLFDFDRVLGLGLANLKPLVIPVEIKDLANKREIARAAKNFTLADQLRNQITAAGFAIDDTSKGPKLKKL